MDRSIYGYIWRFSRRQQLIITAIALASFPFLYAQLHVPIEIVNGPISGKDLPASVFGIELGRVDYLLVLCGILFLLYLINAGFMMVLNTYKNVTSERMLRRLRYMLYQRILRYPPPQFARSSQGELSSMVVAETEQTREFIADALALPVFQGGKMLTILFFMFAQDPLLGLAAIVIIPVQTYIVPKLQRRINQLGRVRVLRAREVAGRVSEGVSGIRDIRTHRTEMFSLADFSHFLGRLFEVRYKIFELKYFMKALNVFMLNMTPLLFYTVGGLLVIWGDLTLGALVAVIGAYGQLTSPWKELLKYYQRLGDAQIKYQQLVAAFDLDDLYPETTLDGSLHEPAPVTGHVRLDGITVTDEDGSNALEQISFEIEPGGRIAVVSDSVGRDRLAQLLLRVVRPNAGTVSIDGKELAGFDERTLGARIGYAGPDSYIFNGNVETNATYALQQHLPDKATSDNYNLDEALTSGNSPYDSTKDWTDLAQAGVANEAEFRNWQRQVLTAVELDDVLFQRALVLTVDGSLTDDLPELIIEARKSILEQIKANPELRGLVHPFDFERFNPNLSVATNIRFGKSTDPEFSAPNLGQNKFFRSVLADAQLERRFRTIGFEVAKEVVELFDDPDAAAAVLDRVGFVDHATLERLRDIVQKAKSADDADLTAEEVAELITLTCQLNFERHRLGHIDKRLKRDIVKARKLFHEKMPPDELSQKIAVFDPEKFNPQLSLRCNLIYGRVNLSRSNSEQQINAVIKDVLTKHGMVEIVLRSALAVEVGIGGQRLPLAARQSLALARNVLKKPSILILNDALSAHDREARDRIRSNVISLLPQASLIWIDSEMPDQSDFDDVLVLRNGRIEERLIEAPKPVLELPVPEVEDDEEAMPRNIGAEASALSHVPMFNGVRPGNLKIIALSSRRIVFEPGEYLMREGEEGNNAYLMLSGEADVVINADAPNESVIATLGRHALVGEVALLADVPRSATVRARDTIEALEIDKGLFLMLIDKDPKLAAAVARTASERLANMLEQSRQAA